MKFISNVLQNCSCTPHADLEAPKGGGFTGLTTPNIPDGSTKILRSIEVFRLVFVFLGYFLFYRTHAGGVDPALPPTLSLTPTLPQAKVTAVRAAKPRDLRDLTKKCADHQ